jgi:hypothetical protein
LESMSKKYVNLQFIEARLLHEVSKRKKMWEFRNYHINE